MKFPPDCHPYFLPPYASPEPEGFRVALFWIGWADVLVWFVAVNWRWI